MSNDEIVRTSSQLIEQAKVRIDQIEGVANRAVFRELLPVADVLTRAKEAYERETETGHGKRNPQQWMPFVEVAAGGLERSASFVERLLKLSQLDGVTRLLAADVPKLIGNQDALLALAREPLPERRQLAIEEFKTGGRAAFKRVLERLLIEPVEVESVNQASVLSFLTGYTEAKQLEAAVHAEHHDDAKEHKSLTQRRVNAKKVFDYLRDGETKLDPAALERLGLTRAACNRAVKDLLHSDMIQSSGHLDDTFEVVDEKDITHLEIEPRRKARLIISVQPGGPVTRKITGGTYEVSVMITGTTVDITLRAS